MINHNKDYIKETYPEIMGDVKTFYVDAGWIPHINKITDEIMRRIGEHNEYCRSKIGLELLQIKEKFGGLRYYYTLTGIDDEKDMDTTFRDEIRKYVSFSEQVSNYICEVCGMYGEAKRPNGWIKTVCEEHSGEKPS